MIIRKTGYDGEEHDYPFSWLRQWRTTRQKVDKWIHMALETPFQFDIRFQEKYGDMVESKTVTWTAVDMKDGVSHVQCQRLEDEINGEIAKMPALDEDTPRMQAYVKDFNILQLKRLNKLKRKHQKLGCPGTAQDVQADAVASLGAAYVAAHKEEDKEAAQQRWELAIAELLDGQQAQENMGFKRVVKICRMLWGTNLHPEQEGEEELEDKADHDMLMIDDSQGDEIAVELEGQLQNTLGELENVDEDGKPVPETNARWTMVDGVWTRVVGEPVPPHHLQTGDLQLDDFFIPADSGDAVMPLSSHNPPAMHGMLSSLAQRTDATKMSDELGQHRGIWDQIVVGTIAGFTTVILILIVCSIISVLATLLWYAFVAGIVVSLGVMTVGALNSMG
jgi:hypothetical protein